MPRFDRTGSHLSPSGLLDFDESESSLGRVAQMAYHFNVPAIFSVNKLDLNRDSARGIEASFKENGLHYIEQISFVPIFSSALVQ